MKHKAIVTPVERVKIKFLYSRGVKPHEISASLHINSRVVKEVIEDLIQDTLDSIPIGNKPEHARKHYKLLGVSQERMSMLYRVTYKTMMSWLSKTETQTTTEKEVPDKAPLPSFYDVFNNRSNQ